MNVSDMFSGKVPAQFTDTLKLGKFKKKTKIDTGDFVEFLYDGERKYMFVLNPTYEGTVHGVDISKLTSEEIQELIKAYMSTQDPQVLYEKVKPITSATRSYRTYIKSKISRTRIVKYEGLIG